MTMRTYSILNLTLAQLLIAETALAHEEKAGVPVPPDPAGKPAPDAGVRPKAPPVPEAAAPAAKPAAPAKEPKAPKAAKAEPPPKVAEPEAPADLRAVHGLKTLDGKIWKATDGGLPDHTKVAGIVLAEARAVSKYPQQDGRFALAKTLAKKHGIPGQLDAAETAGVQQLTKMLCELAAAGVPCLPPSKPVALFARAAVAALQEISVEAETEEEVPEADESSPDVFEDEDE